MSMRAHPALMILLTTVTATAAPLVQVRDAPGGYYPNGQGNGFYLKDTPAVTRVSINASPSFIEYTGAFDFEIDLFDGSGFAPLVTYCIQPDQGIAFGKHPHDLVGATYEIRDLASGGSALAMNADRLQRLWANALDASLQDAVHASAFQFLLWEFVQDEEVDLLAGQFMVDPDDPHSAEALIIAQQWLDLLESETWVEREKNLVLLHSETSQNLLFVVPGPSILVLFAMAVLGFRRRRDRDAPATLDAQTL